MMNKELVLLKNQFKARHLELENKRNALEQELIDEPDYLLTVTTLLDLYLAYSQATQQLILDKVSSEAFTPVFRAAFESFLNIQYLTLTDTVSRQSKALAYRYCEAKNFLSTTDYLYYSNRNEDLEFPESDLLGKSLQQIEAERIKRLRYLEQRKNSSEGTEYRRLKNLHIKRKLSWYSLYSENYSLKDLSQSVGMFDFYQYFYTYLSIASHGVGLFNGEKKQNTEIIQYGVLYFIDYFTASVLKSL